jgi:hypothetical protein
VRRGVEDGELRPVGEEEEAVMAVLEGASAGILEASEEEVPTADDGGEGGVGVKGHGLEEWKCGAVIAGEEVAGPFLTMPSEHNLEPFYPKLRAEAVPLQTVSSRP